mmetsp:Transcript_92048/g.237533  ORF Transcript_92048/g.237533 Transcript_92048/m.237533 type:complete len:238 (+) Transcript_92048:181-894(+)
MMLRHVSRPMKSASVRGPIGTLVPSFIVLSMSSAVAIPSPSTKKASLMYGIRMRLATKPGRSSLVACSFFIAVTRSSVVRSVASSVRSPRMTSTSGITGTGFMKCMPMTRSGRRAIAPSFVIEIEEVLLASTAPSRKPRSCSSWKTDCLMPRSSLTASMTKSRLGTRSLHSSPKVWNLTRPIMSAASASVSRPFFVSFEAQSCTNLRLLSTLSGILSSAWTSRPACRAATMAMPVPI